MLIYYCFPHIFLCLCFRIVSFIGGHRPSLAWDYCNFVLIHCPGYTCVERHCFQ
jgi:hypothetical protein